MDKTEVALPMRRWRLQMEAVGPGRLPGFAGSAWRGVFGHALKRSVCVMRLRPCNGCPLELSCIYPTVFEASPRGETAPLRTLKSIAQPYVLMPRPNGPQRVEAGDRIDLEATIIGKGTERDAYVLRALEEAALRGLGPDRVSFELLGVETRDQDALGEVPVTEEVEIAILTPLRLKEGGALVGADRLEPRHFLMGLVRRVSMLAAFHGNGAIEADFRALKAQAARLVWTRRAFRWRDTVRRSSRQKTEMRMGGVVGSAALAGPGIAPFADFLRVAPWIGVGKGATMGLGQIAFNRSDRLPCRAA